MSKRKLDLLNVVRFNPNTKTGLTKEEVLTRNNQKLTNKSKVKVGKSYLTIIFTDLFSFFNILLFAIAGLMIFAEHYDGLFFLFVLLPNVGITLYEDISARRLLGKLNMVNQPRVNAIRDGIETEIKSDDIVLDDLLHIQGSAQVCVDGILIEGSITVNEALLTGESLPVKKVVGDKIYAGSFTISGDAIVKTEAVGKYCYIETIHEKANRFKRTPSEIKQSLNRLFIGIGAIVITLGIAMCVIYALQGKFNTIELVKEVIRNSISGSMVAMIPSGMYLLTSAAFSLSVINLSQKKAQIQDFYSVEMLSKINVLCVDKTGTITDGQLAVNKVVPINSDFNEQKVGKIISSLVDATKDNNQTARALINKYGSLDKISVKSFISFSSETKFSAISTANGETYLLGAAEFMNLANKEQTISKINELSDMGFRILTLAYNLNPIKDDKVSGLFEAVALIVIEDHIKEDAPETFKWFVDNGVQIKVISGDNARSVSHIATQAGIPNAEKFISLEGMSVEEVSKIANEYTVFGRVSPEQKEAIVMALKENGKKVAMTGDGVNDILALKRSDCSIAMANGSDAARHVSNIVLMDSNFHSLPNVVAEGRKIVNNLQRTCSLFLVKTMFAMFFSIAFLVASFAMNDNSIAYPWLTNHLYLWEIFGIGMSAFFIAIENNETKYDGRFLKNILTTAVPAGLIVILSISTIFLFGIIKRYGGYDFGIMNMDTLVAMSTVTFSLISLVILYRVCQPLNKYRGVIFGGACTFIVGIITVAAIITQLTGSSDKTIVRIPFEAMTPVSWFVTAIVTIAAMSLYLLVTYLIKFKKGEIKNANN